MDNIENSFLIIKKVLIVVDLYIAKKIAYFFFDNGYFDQNIIPYLSAKIPIFVRFLFYLIVFFVLLVPLKVVFPESRIRSAVTYSVFILIILGILGIFLGFFQLMYSF